MTNGATSLSVPEIAVLCDNKGLINSSQPDCLKHMMSVEMHGQFCVENLLAKTTFKDYPESFNWRNLFHKLIFEEFLSVMNLSVYWTRNPLKLLCTYIDALAPELTVVRIQVDYKRLKSKNYWLMMLLSRLTNLRAVFFHADASYLHVDNDYFKFMKKGLAYNQKNGGCLEKILFKNMLGPSFSREFLQPVLMTQPSLTCLILSNNKIGMEDAKAIKKVLQTFKAIREIDISNTDQTTDTSKEIADGIIQAKKLEVFKCASNPNMDPESVNQLIYNLTFLPNLSYINLSQAKCDTTTCENIKKFFQIQGSIETFIMQNTTLLTIEGSDQIFIAAGFNKSIRYVNFDSDQHMLYVASALQIAQINAHRGFNLKALSLKGCLYSSTGWPLSSFVSQEQLENWESGKNLTSEHIKNPKNYLELEYIDLSNSDFSFLGKEINKNEILKQTKPEWPSYLQLASLSDLTLIARNVKLNEQSAHMIEIILRGDAFGPCKIKNLDVSMNNFGIGIKLIASAFAKNDSVVNLDVSQCSIGVQGMKALASALKQNSKIKWLNLYRNLIDVDGARLLADALKVNKTIQFLDIGFNRIRNTGLKAIAEALQVNNQNQIQRLAIRANFITDEGLQMLFDKLVLVETSRITHLFVKHNLLNERFKLDLHYKLKKLYSSQVYDNDYVACLTQIPITFGSQWSIPQRGFEHLAQHNKKQIFVDEFQSIDFLEENSQKKSVWLAPLPQNYQTEREIKQRLNQWSIGLITDVRIRSGRNVIGRPQKNFFMIVEFADEASVTQTIQYQKQYHIIGSQEQKSFRVGTRTANPIKAFLSKVRENNKKKRKQARQIK